MAQGGKIITISYDAILRVAQLGIHRAAVFLGLGVNAADDPRLLEYHLVKDTNFRLLPEKVTEGVLKEWKAELRIWIVGCGFKELVDRLCVFLDEIHRASCHVDKNFTEARQKKFEKLGLDKKIQKLDAEFGIKGRFGTQLATFYQIRNCFVHRLGFVGTEDVKDGGTLGIRFIRLSSVFTPQSGQTTEIPDLFDPNSPAFVAPVEGQLGLKLIDEKIEFKVGEWISFSPKTLTEILFFSGLCAADYIKSAVEFAKSRGCKIDSA